MSDLPEKNTETLNWISSFIQKTMDLYHRIRDFDSSIDQRPYLRALSWTSLVLAFAVLVTEILLAILLEILLGKVGQVANLQSNIKNIQLAVNIILITVIPLVVVLLLNITLIVWSDFRTQREVQSLRDEWLEKGIKSGILKTTETLDLDPSVLRNIMSWLYDYGHNNKDVDAAFDLFTQLIARFTFLNFHPIGQIGEQVVFDPNLHRNIEANIHPGDAGYIYETGWILDNEIIRKPLVVRNVL